MEGVLGLVLGGVLGGFSCVRGPYNGGLMGVLGGLRRIVRWRLWKGLAFV